MASTSNHSEKIKNMFGSLLISIIVVLVGFSLNVGRGDIEKLEQLNEKKVDKETYRVDMETINRRLEAYERNQIHMNDEIKAILKDLSTQNAAIKTDIEWIKREINTKEFANK